MEDGSLGFWEVVGAGGDWIRVARERLAVAPEGEKEKFGEEAAQEETTGKR